jgi:hypothetical protein
VLLAAGPEAFNQKRNAIKGRIRGRAPWHDEVEVSYLADGPDLLPGLPGTLDSSDPAAPEGLEAGAFAFGAILSKPLVPLPAPSEPDDDAGPFLLPGSPAVPGLEVPPAPGAFCVALGLFFAASPAVESAAMAGSAKAIAVTRATADIILIGFLPVVSS